MFRDPIFIGGTGRSGTTLLQKVIGRHKDIFCLPFESRFIIDTNGLIDLVFHLTDGWTPVNADMAIKRFRRLMLKDLNRWYSFPYRGFQFSRYFSEPFYSNHVKQFIKSLAPLYFIGRTALRRGYYRQIIFYANLCKKEKLLEKCAEFVDSLFCHIMELKGKRTWAEKTPHNVLHLGFLNNMFPQSRFIFIYRDPRDVVASLLKQQWAPDSLEGAVQWLLDVYKRYDQQRKTYPYIPVYELSMESLIEDPEKELTKLAEYLELEPEFDITQIDFSHAHIGRWREDIDLKSHNILEDSLKPYLERYNYK